jgi:hypothetical protein
MPNVSPQSTPDDHLRVALDAGCVMLRAIEVAAAQAPDGDEECRRRIARVLEHTRDAITDLRVVLGRDSKIPGGFVLPKR